MTAMNEPNDTNPQTENSDQAVTPEKKVKFRWWYVLIGLVIILVGAGIGGSLGYQAGLKIRLAAQEDQKVMLATEQFQQGVVDLTAGKFETARKRFEYVISIDPTFPGASDKLAEAMIGLAQVSTPTPEPLPTAEPTPDTRNEEQLFTQIQSDLQNKSWEDAVTTIEKLRDLNLSYRTVDVDGMYYIALRFLGIQKILNEGQLEVGNYYLTLSERFAPLDVDAANYRNWSRMYLSAASFWGVDWAKVVSAFGEIYPSLPGLMDASKMTATERFRLASISYGDDLYNKEQYCDAQKQYENGLALGDDAHGKEMLSKATDYCANPPGDSNNQNESPTPTLEVSPTPTTEVPVEQPTDAPTVAPTVEPTVAPTDAPQDPTPETGGQAEATVEPDPGSGG
jgi:tetratricopeptide (TPR) repeat protein